MSKYKLIKSYPGSPELNTEIIKSKIYYADYLNQGSYETFMVKGDNGFNLNNPQDYPEFWEKVVEKDYEILSFISDKNCIDTKRENGKFLAKNLKGEGYYIESGYLKCNSHNIHSVQRLSDGEI
jgi:hypothetical protein